MSGVLSELRSFLDLRGAALQSHSFRRLFLTLSYGCYYETKDRSVAIEIANEIIATGRRVRQNIVSDIGTESVLPSGVSGGNEYLSKGIVPHNVAISLKDADKKFLENQREFWINYVDEYQQIAGDYKLNQGQKL